MQPTIYSTNLFNQFLEQLEEAGVGQPGGAVASPTEQLPHSWQHRLLHVHVVTPVLDDRVQYMIEYIVHDINPVV